MQTSCGTLCYIKLTTISLLDGSTISPLISAYPLPHIPVPFTIENKPSLSKAKQQGKMSASVFCMQNSVERLYVFSET